MSQIEISPRFFEVDSYNVVNNMFYLSWCEMGRFDVAQKAGLLDSGIADGEIRFMVKESRLHYEKPVHFYNKVILHTQVETTGTSRLNFKHRIILKNTRETAAYGETATVCIKNGRLLPKLPTEVEKRVQAYIKQNQGSRT